MLHAEASPPQSSSSRRHSEPGGAGLRGAAGSVDTTWGLLSMRSPHSAECNSRVDIMASIDMPVWCSAGREPPARCVALRRRNNR